jgi:hypothetical protein
MHQERKKERKKRNKKINGNLLARGTGLLAQETFGA